MKKVSAYYAGQYKALVPRLKDLLTEGSVTQETLLDNVTRVMAVIRYDWKGRLGVDMMTGYQNDLMTR